MRFIIPFLLAVVFFAATATMSRADFTSPEGKPCPCKSFKLHALPGKQPMKGTALYQRYEDVGFCGSDFKTKCGILVGGEGGLMTLHALDGRVWLVHFEASFKPLEVREIYWAEISPDSTKGCGVSLGEFESVPPKCIIRERAMSWEESKQFLRRSLIRPSVWIVELEKFLRERTPKVQ